MIAAGVFRSLQLLIKESVTLIEPKAKLAVTLENIAHGGQFMGNCWSS